MTETNHNRIRKPIRDIFWRTAKSGSIFYKIGMEFRGIKAKGFSFANLSAAETRILT